MGSRNAAVVSFHFRHIFAICWPSEKMPPGLVTESTIWSAVPSALFICRSSTYTRPFLNTNSFWKVPLGLFCGAGAHSSQSLMGKIKGYATCWRVHIPPCLWHGPILSASARQNLGRPGLGPQTVELFSLPVAFSPFSCNSSSSVARKVHMTGRMEPIDGDRWSHQ